MYRFTSNYLLVMTRAARRFGISWLAVGLLAAIPISGCSSSNTNPPMMTTSANTFDAVTSDPQVQKVLYSSCYDCHSEQGSPPWNAKLAPSYLFGAGDARNALDFSAWQSYDAKRKQNEMKAIAEAVENGSMPPGDYEFLHPEAEPNAEERQILVQWASKMTPVAAH